MNPFKSNNIVAKIIQVYSYLNVIGGIIFAFEIADATSNVFGWLYFAVVLVVSFLLFAFGEVIDLLQDIKMNTSSTAAKSYASKEKSPVIVHNTAPTSEISNFYNKPSTKTAASGSWTCSCGRTNATYVVSCVCGKSKYD